MRSLFLLLLFFVSSAFAEEWKCSNWVPGISSILVHTGDRGTLIKLGKSFDDLRVAKEHFARTKSVVRDLSKELKGSWHPVLVKEGKKFSVLLNECFTPSEAATILLRLQGREEVVFENYKQNKFQVVKDPDCVHCR